MFIWTLSLKFWYRQLSKQVRFKVKSKIYFALKYNNYIKVKSNFFRFKIWTFFLYKNFYIKFSSKGGRYCLRRQYICPLHLERNRMIWCHRYFYIVQYKELPGINKHKNMGFFLLWWEIKCIHLIMQILSKNEFSEMLEKRLLKWKEKKKTKSWIHSKTNNPHCICSMYKVNGHMKTMHILWRFRKLNNSGIVYATENKKSRKVMGLLHQSIIKKNTVFFGNYFYRR